MRAFRYESLPFYVLIKIGDPCNMRLIFSNCFEFEQLGAAAQGLASGQSGSVSPPQEIEGSTAGSRRSICDWQREKEKRRNFTAHMDFCLGDIYEQISGDMVWLLLFCGQYYLDCSRSSFRFGTKPFNHHLWITTSNSCKYLTRNSVRR